MYNNNYYGNNFNSRSNLDWIMVQNVDQIAQVSVQPNTKAWIMVQSEPIFALKTADAVGLSTTELYKFEKYQPHNEAEYITATQLTDILNKFKEDIINESTNKQPAKRKPASEPIEG